MKLKSGFTIVEVLVVIGIIAILTVIVFPSISNIRAKNRDAERIADIAALQLGLSLYYNQNPIQGYPGSLDDLAIAGYITTESLVDSTGENYEYVPLKRSASDKCIYYHLGIELELPNAQIDTANTFSSLPNAVSNDYVYCAGYSGPGIDGAYSQNPSMYSVHP